MCCARLLRGALGLVGGENKADNCYEEIPPVEESACWHLGSWANKSTGKLSSGVIEAWKRWGWTDRFFASVIFWSGYGEVWFFQKQLTRFCSLAINRRLYDITLQEIKDACSHSNKGRNCLVLKAEWSWEKYIMTLDQREIINMFRYSTSKHRLPVETGRFSSIDYKDRLCHKCTKDIGDEFHYIMTYPFF